MEDLRRPVEDKVGDLLTSFSHGRVVWNAGISTFGNRCQQSEGLGWLMIETGTVNASAIPVDLSLSEHSETHLNMTLAVENEYWTEMRFSWFFFFEIRTSLIFVLINRLFRPPLDKLHFFQANDLAEAPRPLPVIQDDRDDRRDAERRNDERRDQQQLQPQLQQGRQQPDRVLKPPKTPVDNRPEVVMPRMVGWVVNLLKIWKWFP